jgi:hypothetical protein
MAQNNLDVQRTIQAVTSGLTITGLGITVALARIYRDKWFYAIPWILWLLLVIFFYVIVFTEDYGIILMTHPDFTTWSALVRLYGIATFCGTGLALIQAKVEARGN